METEGHCMYPSSSDKLYWDSPFRMSGAFPGNETWITQYCSNRNRTKLFSKKEKEEAERQKQRSRNWGYHCQIPDTEVDEQSKLTEAAKLMSAEEMQRPYVDEGIFNPLNIYMLDNIKEQ